MRKQRGSDEGRVRTRAGQSVRGSRFWAGSTCEIIQGPCSAMGKRQSGVRETKPHSTRHEHVRTHSLRAGPSARAGPAGPSQTRRVGVGLAKGERRSLAKREERGSDSACPMGRCCAALSRSTDTGRQIALLKKLDRGILLASAWLRRSTKAWLQSTKTGNLRRGASGVWPRLGLACSRGCKGVF